MASEVEKFLKNPVVQKVGIGLAAYFFVVRPILQKVGVLDSEENAQADANLQTLQQLLAPGSFITTLNQLGGNYSALPTPFSSAKTVELSRTIEDSFGFINDDESAIIAAFQACKSQLQARGVSYAYNVEFKKDLYTDLDKYLSENDMLRIYNIIASKPKI